MTRMSPGKLIRLRRLADDDGRFKMLAIDQRPPIESLVCQARGIDGPAFDDVVAVKESLLANLAPYASAVLMDPQYIFPAALLGVPRDCGLLVTLEHDKFEETTQGRLSSAIPHWSVQKIQSSGGDAVKVLAWYRPDADERVKEHQFEFVAGIGSQCARLDIPFVLELLLYPFPDEESHTSEYVEDPAKQSDHVVESVETFAHERFGVDLFKLESPVPISALAGERAMAESQIADKFSELDRAAGRPWVMLSAGADAASFHRILEQAFDAGASGFLAGRAIWWDACLSSFPDRDAMNAALAAEAIPYMEKINDLADQNAIPWTSHRRFGATGPQPPAAGEDFRRSYLEEPA